MLMAMGTDGLMYSVEAQEEKDASSILRAGNKNFVY